MALQSLQNGAIRRSIGLNLGIVTLGAATSTEDNNTLIDTKNLLGGDDEHNQKEVLIYDATGSIVDGETSVVDDFASATKEATMLPVFTANITSGDKYEMWRTPWRIADINDAINQAINDVTGKALQIKDDDSLFTGSSKYLYTIPPGFTHLFLVEYLKSVLSLVVEDCEDAWTAGSNVTATKDTFFVKKGTYGAKLVVAAGASATAILGYKDFTAMDITAYDKVEFSMYSSIALTAGQLQIHMGSTAAISSAEETIDIPAMAAAKEYRHSISLENPHLDTAIISAGIYQVADVGACTLYIDDIVVVNSVTKEYKEIPIEYWDIARGATSKLAITVDGLRAIGSDKQLMLRGFQIPSRMTADTDTSEINPAFLIARVTGRLLISHAKSSFLDIHDRARLSTYWLSEAARMESGLTTILPGTTRVI